MKKTIALFLCVIMMVSLFVGTVSAADPTDYATYADTEDGGFVILESKGVGSIYASYYFESFTFQAGTTYEINFSAMCNTGNMAVMYDVEQAAGGGGFDITSVDTWANFTADYTPAANGNALRIYVNEVDGDAGQIAFKNLVVVDKSTGDTVVSWDGTTNAGRSAGNATFISKLHATPELTNLFTLEEVSTEDFLALQPTSTNGYAAYYIRAKLEKGEEYTIKFKMISNTLDNPVMVDLEGQGGVTTKSVTNSVVDKWEEVSVTIMPTAKYQDAGGDIQLHGWPLRLYVNKAVDAQIFIDDIKIVDSDGKTVIKQDFAEAGIKDIVTWNSGNAVHIPIGYLPYQEGEILGFNELVGGDFEDEALMKHWWSRTDWNGGSYTREKGKGFDGSYGLVARGTGAGTNDQNAGCFYTVMGEGTEASLPLNAGKTYVLTYKVFRPEGVDSYTYIDINEGSAVNGTATANGEWETVTARFVAPEGPVKIRLVVNALAKGEYVVFDDIELRQVNGDPDGVPYTSDAMNIGLVVAAMVVAVLGVAVVIRKRMFSK